MAVTLKQIKELREKTGAGVTAVKEALESAKGDFDKAIVYLREKGLAKAVKRSDKRAEKVFIAHYIHREGTIASMVELNSETDFAAMSEKFRAIAHDLAVHVVAMSPEYVAVENVPAEIVEKEKAIALKTIDAKKPKDIIEQIVAGKLQKYYQEFVLLEQPFYKDEHRKIKDLINELVAAIGERIEVGRFIRVEIGKPATLADNLYLRKK